MIDVLVPVLGRPVQEMLHSLERSTVEDYDVFLICSPGDEQIEACRSSGHVTWVVPWEPDRGDFAKKINWAFARTSGEWIFQGADDIRFSPGWDVAALRVARETGAQVIGTNDLHNPAVKSGTHSTHTLVSRSYVSLQGGTYDGPGQVFCEAYDHQFVDNELIDLARRRGVWAFSADSIVEHLHPHWGNGKPHPTYEKAMRQTAADKRLFHVRSRGSAFAQRRRTRRRMPPRR